MKNSRAAIHQPKAAKKRKKRKAIVLKAAVEEFDEVGLDGASLASIAAKAEVSKALVLTYFGSMEGLYAAYRDRVDQDEAELTESEPTKAEKEAPKELSAAEMAMASLSTILNDLADRPRGWNVLDDGQRQVITDQATRYLGTVKRLKNLDNDDIAILADAWANSVTAVIDWWRRHPDVTAADVADRCSRILKALAKS